MCSLVLKDQFHKMVELTMAARQAYKTMLETMRQEQAGEPGPQTPPSPPMQDPIQSTEEGTLASTGEEPHYSECFGERGGGGAGKESRPW